MAVRCRPINETELRQGHTVVVKADEMHGTITISKLHSKHDDEVKTFTFDTVFGPDSKQLDIYNATARPIVEFVIEGYNGQLLIQLTMKHSARLNGQTVTVDQDS